jgi:hypothetical protein
MPVKVKSNRIIKDQTDEEKENASPTNGGISYPALYPNAGAFFYTKGMNTRKKSGKERNQKREI